MAGEGLGGPYQTANEIEAYKGDAALGYSGDNAIQYNGNPADTNPLSGLDNTLARMQSEDANMRMQRHLEKRQDLENIYKTLRGVGGSAFNMKGPNGKDLSFTPLPEDRKVLESKADEVRKYITAHPSTYQNDNKYLQMVSDLDSHSDVAGRRAIFHADQNAAAAQEQDPDERQGILQNINKELSTPLSNLSSPTPYMQKPKLVNDIDLKHYEDAKNRQQLGVTTEMKKMPDGTMQEVQVETSVIPKATILSPLTDFSKAMTENTKNYVNAWNSTPESKNPASVIELNKKIDQNAARLGIQPYYPATVDASGNVIPNPNKREAYTGLRIQSYGNPIKVEKITDTRDKAKEAKSKLLTEAVNRKKTLREIEAIDSKELDPVGKQAVVKVYKQTEDLRNKKDFVSLNKLEINPVTDGMKLYLTNNGIDGSQYEVSPISAKDATIANIGGEQAQDATGQSMSGVNKPGLAFYLKSNTGDINDDRYAFAFERNVPGVNEEGKNTLKKETYYKLVSPKEAIGHTIKSEKNHNSIDDKTLTSIGNGEKSWDELVGNKPKAVAPKEEVKEVPEKQFTVNGAVIIPEKQSDGTYKAMKDGKMQPVYGKFDNGELIFDKSELNNIRK